MSPEKLRIDRTELLQALSEGAVVATANARLSRSLLSEYERGQLEQGREAWATPAVLPLEAWLLALLTQASLYTDLPRLLTADQEQQVWAAIIRRDDDNLLRVEAAAQRAAAAWKLVRAWRLDLADRRFGTNENTESFRRWALAFRAECTGRDRASEADAGTLLLPLLRDGVCSPPSRLLLVGFYQLTPEQKALAEVLRDAGCAVEWVAAAGFPGRARRLQAEDVVGEIKAAANWARGILEAEPAARIGIVVPDLAERRATLENLLARTLDPGSLSPGARQRTRPWNISLGRPLAAWPVVRAAFGLLSLMRGPLDLALLGELLASPHWAFPDEPEARRAARSGRALLDARLRRRGDAAVRLSTLHFLAGQCAEDGTPKPWRCPDLARRLDALLRRSRDLPARATAGAWANEFAAWLRAAGWAGSTAGGGRPLDSHEYQAVEAWNQLLSRLASLDDFAGSLSLSAASGLLGRLANETVFQPRADEAAVHVLGLHEANGLVFDHLWVMGLHDAAWPPAPAPDPFLPLALQRESGLPRCDPERERSWAAGITAELAAAAPDVVFSHPARDGAEAQVPSPLLDGCEQVTAADLGIERVTGWFEAIRDSATCEPAPPPNPIPLESSEGRGGSRLFRHQAACPFRAFAEHRLGARPLDRVQQGLDPARRGSLLHAVLEALWRELRSHSNLVALDDAALRERVRAHIAAGLDEMQSRSPVTLTARYREVEAARLEDKLLGWLEIERRRTPFCVTGFEEVREVEIGGVRTRLVIDRMDELENGERVVLDYKTGQVQPGGWFGERPDDPQLPLYGVVSAADSAGSGAGVAAVAFAQIRPDAAGFSGVVRADGILPGLPVTRSGPLREATEHWPRVLADWRSVLEGLAGEFRRGYAAVDPKRGVQTCRKTYCELGALCRISQRMNRGRDEDGVAEPGDG